MITPESLGPVDGDGGTSSTGPGPSPQGGVQNTTAATEVPELSPDPALSPPDYPRRTFYGAPDTPSEFSWGPGQVPAGYERLGPSEGGAYRGRSPRYDAQGRMPRVQKGRAYGVPGERVR